MLNRSAPGNVTRPPQPQRSYSGTYIQQTVHRPNQPSRLQNVRSVSSTEQFVDLTADGTDARNVQVWQQNRERTGLGGVLDAIEVDDDIEETRPRKKAKLETEGAFVESPQHEQHFTTRKQVEDAFSKTSGESLDYPPRNRTMAVRGPRRKATNDPARKSEGITPPAMATRLPPPKSVADFSPWTGLHPEDILNEQVIKTGYFDKPPGPSQNESNSARQSIWPNLSQKNNIALQTLSHLFTQVLDKRQGLARCTAPSTFKPPPRVTVTDTKREAWLKDLANPNIPLRRQSRTIPHGIRGKLLMEQCLAKSMPLQRAIWLAKCVGANELRSFRRKGVSGSAAAQGETKWVRDWTIQVEQFLESVADACGQENWRAKIDYAIKLAATFYSEGLLDRDEYLDWLVRAFASASLATLPLWLIIVQIYWRDLITIGRRGRKLAGALLEHLHLVVEKRSPAFEPLKLRLQKLITVLATTANGCLILPRAWKKHQELLDQELPKPSPELQHAMTSIVRRNERLAAPMGRTVESTRSPLLSLYLVLDNVDINTNMDMLPSRCLGLVPDAHELVRAILHWSSTVYRRGRARVYIAAKIVAHLHVAGHDTNSAILAYLQQPNSALPSEARQVWAVVGELLSIDCFAIGAYLQWIITSGAAFRAEGSSMATGLLASLPVDKMPRRLRNLRKTLLERLGQTVDEESLVVKAKFEIEHALTNYQVHFEDSENILAALSGSAQLTVSGWMCRELINPTAGPNLSVAAFGVMRSIFECFGDLRALARLVEAALLTDDSRLLACAADTLNTHALGLAVLGSMHTSIDRLMDRHRALRRGILDRTSLLAYIALIKRFPNRAQDAQLLRSDLAAYEQQHSAAVCSPASDNIIGMQAGTLDNDAEIDAVFASGNSMDEQTMQRVFLRVMERAGKVHDDTAEPESNVHRWLDQLRSVDGPGFERLAGDYVNATMLKSQTSVVNTSGIVALVASRCLGLEAVTSSGSQVSSKTAAAMLELIAAPAQPTGLSAAEEYTFKLQQQRFYEDQSEDVMNLLRKATEDQVFPLDSDRVLGLTLQIITGHPDKFRDCFTEDQSSPAVQQAAVRISEALLSQDQTGTAASGLDACQVIRSSNALNAPFSIGWLHIYTSSQTTTATGNEDAIRNALLKAVADKSEVWPQLLSAAKSETLKEIHMWARSSILAEVCAVQEDDHAENKTGVEMFCQVLDVTYGSIKGEDDAQNLVLLTDKLKAQERSLSDLDATDPAYRTHHRILTGRLNILLHLCTLPAQATSISDNGKQARTHLLAALCSLLIHPRLDRHQSLTDHIHDVAALHADTLPEETLSQLSRQFHPTISTAQLRSLLGSFNTQTVASTTPTLALASRAQPAQSQQQRALARRQPLPVSSGGVGGVGGAARPPNVERKLTPYPLRNWEIMPDPTPVMGENDCAVSLGLFGARKV
jgi:mediator of RNA polymerase II transcription subunit 12